MPALTDWVTLDPNRSKELAYPTQRKSELYIKACGYIFHPIRLDPERKCIEIPEGMLMTEIRGIDNSFETQVARIHISFLVPLEGISLVPTDAERQIYKMLGYTFWESEND